MSSRTVHVFPFLEDDKKNSGAVEVVRTDYDDRTVIGLRLRIGSRSINLPRNKVAAIIDAMQRGDIAASRVYTKLIEEMNEHV